MPKLKAVADGAFLSLYDRRVILVRDQIMANSTLDKTSASAIAVHVLHALDTIPEHIR
jgi:hypothetical protein